MNTLRTVVLLTVLTLALAAVLLLPARLAHADGSEVIPLPTNIGCYGIDTYGISMFGGGAGSVTVNRSSTSVRPRSRQDSRK